MVKHPFVVGFLVAEFPQMILGGEPTPSTGESCYLPNSEDSKLLELQTYDKGQSNEILYFTTEQRLNAENISRSITMAYVMDQVIFRILEFYICLFTNMKFFFVGYLSLHLCISVE